MSSKNMLTLLVVMLISALTTACGLLLGSGDGAPIPLTATPGSGETVRGLAVVERVEIQMLESFPVQVNVLSTGYLPDSCTSLQETTQGREGQTFMLQVFTSRPAGAICAEQIFPFQISTPLDVGGLKAGDYTVNVNGKLASFNLPQDNVVPEPPGSLSGLVWHDMCAVAGGESGIPMVPSAGCVPVENSYRANGLEDVDEPGLGGVLVHLGLGSCPATSQATTTTAADGSYSFKGLQPGTYCLFIDPLDAQNTPILVPGDWTFPADAIGQAIAMRSVPLSSAEDRRRINFGWDYQFLPVPPVISTPTPTATPSPTAVPTPCNWAKFVADVTVPDNTPFSPGASFTKTWRLQNIGTCTWTTAYQLVFVSGNAMSDKVAYPLSGTVRPGESIDLSVNMFAPHSVGSHKGSWMLRSDDGKLFGLGASADGAFWALIKVIAANDRYNYDFAANYCLAKWTSDSGKLACPGNTKDAKGSVTLLDRPSMENRSDDEPALWLRPNQSSEGWISGEYPAVKVRQGDHFRAWIGCLSGSTGCDVTFTLRYRVDGGSQKMLGEWRETFDGEITVVDLDLTFLAGSSVAFMLSAEVNNSKYEAANAFWFVPRIENVENSGPPPDSDPAVQAAKKRVAEALDIPLKNIKVLSVEGPVTWQNSCLDVQLDGVLCSEVLTPGFRIMLKHGKLTIEAHTNLDGTVVYWFYSG